MGGQGREEGEGTGRERRVVEEVGEREGNGGKGRGGGRGGKNEVDLSFGLSLGPDNCALFLLMKTQKSLWNSFQQL